MAYRPIGRARLVVVLALFVLPVRSWLEDRAASPVNSAVQRDYLERSGVENVKADCGRIKDKRNGLESWVCDIETPLDYDVCLADIRRRKGVVAAEVHDCLNDGTKASRTRG